MFSPNDGNGYEKRQLTLPFPDLLLGFFVILFFAAGAVGTLDVSGKNLLADLVAEAGVDEITVLAEGIMVAPLSHCLPDCGDLRTAPALAKRLSIQIAEIGDLQIVAAADADLAVRG